MILFRAVGCQKDEPKQGEEKDMKKLGFGVILGSLWGAKIDQKSIKSRSGKQLEFGPKNRGRPASFWAGPAECGGRRGGFWRGIRTEPGQELGKGSRQRT